MERSEGKEFSSAAGRTDANVVRARVLVVSDTLAAAREASERHTRACTAIAESSSGS